MAGDPQTAAPRRFRFQTRHWVFSAGVALVMLVMAALAWLDTGGGHRFIIDRIEALAPRSGLKIRLGKIEGSIYKQAVPVRAQGRTALVAVRLVFQPSGY